MTPYKHQKLLLPLTIMLLHDKQLFQLKKYMSAIYSILLLH